MGARAFSHSGLGAGWRGAMSIWMGSGAVAMVCIYCSATVPPAGFSSSTWSLMVGLIGKARKLALCRKLEDVITSEARDLLSLRITENRFLASLVMTIW